MVNDPVERAKWFVASRSGFKIHPDEALDNLLPQDVIRLIAFVETQNMNTEEIQNLKKKI